MPCRLEATNSSFFMTGPGGQGNRTNGALPSLKITIKREEERERGGVVCVCFVCRDYVLVDDVVVWLLWWMFASFVRSFVRF